MLITPEKKNDAEDRPKVHQYDFSSIVMVMRVFIKNACLEHL